MKTKSLPLLITAAFLPFSLSVQAVENTTHENTLNVVAPPGAPLIPTIDHTEIIFVLSAYQDIEHQRRLAEIAIQKSPSAELKQLVSTLIEEYAKITQGMVLLSSNKGVSLIIDPTLEQKTAEEDLGKLFGTEFFTEYLDHTNIFHTRLVESFEKASLYARDLDVKSFAESNLPVIRRHLQLIKSISQKIKETEADKVSVL